MTLIISLIRPSLPLWFNGIGAIEWLDQNPNYENFFTAIDETTIEINNSLNEIKLGKLTENHIIFDTLAFNGVSRKHAVIQKTGNKWFITDLNSTYGTKIENRNIMLTPMHPVELLHKDKISLGYKISNNMYATIQIAILK